MKIRTLVLAAATVFGVSPFAMADAVKSGTIYRLGGTAVGQPISGAVVTSTIDHIPFRVNAAGSITFTVLSYEQSGFFTAPIDMNGDGEIAFIDSYVRVFRNDGSLDAGDHLGANDDAGVVNPGSINTRDSFLSLVLPVGNYILTIGAPFHSIGDAIAGVNPTGSPMTVGPASAYQLRVNDHGDYRVTIGGNVTLIPLPPAAWGGAATLAGLGLFRIARRRGN